MIERGDSWFTTKDTELAAILTALDFEFYDPESPADIRLKGRKDNSNLAFPKRI